MITDKYLTADELREIANTLDTLNDADRRLSKQKLIPVFLFQAPDGMGTTYALHDSNGDVMGHIGYGDEGLAFYLDNGDGDAE